MERPSEAELAGATMFYYTDASDTTQGPFAAGHMRSWFQQGYLLPTTPLAPSFYGEVPQHFWALSALWTDTAVAFSGAADAPL